MPEWGFVFDLDDTLYLERDYVRSGFRAAADWALRTHDIEGLFERAWGLFENGSRARIFDRALDDLGVRPGPELIRQLVDVYRAHSPSIKPLPDAAAALGFLRRHGVLALITDGPPGPQRAKVAALDLWGAFDVAIFTDDFGLEFRKPHPRAFAAVQRAAQARRYVYVGDNPAKDFASPRMMGWSTIRVRRPGGLHAGSDSGFAADFEVRSLEELPAILGGLSS